MVENSLRPALDQPRAGLDQKQPVRLRPRNGRRDAALGKKGAAGMLRDGGAAVGGAAVAHDHLAHHALDGGRDQQGERRRQVPGVVPGFHKD